LIDSLGDLGAALIAKALVIAWLFGSIAIAMKLHPRLARHLPRAAPPFAHYAIGAATFIAAATALGFLIFPAMETLERRACRHATNFEDCMDPPAME
jgi:hypothetical protein